MGIGRFLQRPKQADWKQDTTGTVGGVALAVVELPLMAVTLTAAAKGTAPASGM